MKIKLLLLIFSIFVGIIGADAIEEDSNINITDTSTDISADASSTIYSEAGMSAYAKATTTIDLNNVRSMFRIIETETSDYIIGSVPATSLPETEDVRAYVDKTGWILVYYPKATPASKMVQWANYNGGPITSTILADMVSAMASAAGVSHSGIKHYNFKYPSANKMMMIADWESTTATDSHQIKIPSGFALSENSWSFRSANSRFSLSIDGNNFPASYGSYATGYAIRYGYYSGFMSPDVFHTITFRLANSYGGSNPGGIITVLIYKEP